MPTEGAKIHYLAGPVTRTKLPVEERLMDMVSEMVFTHSEEAAIEEAKRGVSCGKCFDCGTCWGFFWDNAIVRPLGRHGEYKLKLEFCTGCEKCYEVCPYGYIEMF